MFSCKYHGNWFHRSGSSEVDNTLNCQSRDHKINSPLLLSPFFMPPTYKKLRGHIGLSLSVTLSCRPDILRTVRYGWIFLQNKVTVTVWKFKSTLAKFMSTLAFKSIQMAYSLKSLHPWFSNFTCSMTRLQGFRMIKFMLVGNQKWPLLLKIAN